MMPDPTAIDPAPRDGAPIDPAPPEAVDLSQGLKLAAIALVSAAVTATLVIAVGGALILQSVSAG